MLAQTATGVDEALKRLDGTAVFKTKLDGARVQIHLNWQAMRFMELADGPTDGHRSPLSPLMFPWAGCGQEGQAHRHPLWTPTRPAPAPSRQ